MRIPEDVRFVTVKNRGNGPVMLNWTIAAECKKCAQGQFADSTFAKDLKRMQGSLKVGGRLTFAAAQMGAEVIPGLLESIRKATSERREYGKGIRNRAKKP